MLHPALGFLFRPSRKLGRIALATLALASTSASGCTIFVLTDADRTLFFNNEDWSNPEGRLWFIPAGDGHLGCAYVGFDDGWAQGGMNTAGLAFDWVAGPEVAYIPDAGLKRVRGNSAQRMLETCTTVDEAVAFYRSHRETEFARARILIADRSGSSVIIGAKEGALHFQRETRSRGFGFGGKTLQQRLAAAPEPTLDQGASILRACLQTGATPTQYANVFDLRSAEIMLFPDPKRTIPVRLSLTAELARGGHAYDIRRFTEPAGIQPSRLRNEQKRFYLDEFSGAEKDDPATAEKLARILRDCSEGRMRPEDYTPELWSRIAPAREEMRAQIARLGTLQKIVLLQASTDSASARTQRCIAHFSSAKVLQRFELTPGGTVAHISTEFVEMERP